MPDNNYLTFYRAYLAAQADLREANLGGSPAEIRDAEEKLSWATREMDLCGLGVAGHA